MAGSLLSALCLANPVGFSDSSPLEILDTRKEANGCIGHLHSCDKHALELCCSGKCIYSCDVHGYACASLLEENEEVAESAVSTRDLFDSALEAREDESANKRIRDYYSCPHDEPQPCCSGKCVYTLFTGYVCSTTSIPDDEAKPVDDAPFVPLSASPVMSETRPYHSTTMVSAPGTGSPWPGTGHTHHHRNKTVPSTAIAPNQPFTETDLLDFAPRSKDVPKNDCNDEACKDDEQKCIDGQCHTMADA